MKSVFNRVNFLTRSSQGLSSNIVEESSSGFGISSETINRSRNLDPFLNISLVIAVSMSCSLGWSSRTPVNKNIKFKMYISQKGSRIQVLIIRIRTFKRFRSKSDPKLEEKRYQNPHIKIYIRTHSHLKAPLWQK